MKRYRGTTMEHREEAGEAMRLARMQLKKAKAAVAMPIGIVGCVNAFTAITRAERAASYYDGERFWADRGNSRMRASVGVDRALQNVKTRFLKLCLKRR
jgi:hypothetical protein